MATAKQLAAQKLFVTRVRSGEFTPTKKRASRLKAQRAANTRAGYFPNPTRVGGFKFQVQARATPINPANPEAGWKTIATFAEKSKAVEYAKALSKFRHYTAIRVTW